ncbi:hypothetical protein [Seohaeicola zhoushanensis]|uniref:Uncharacterized protein n=1 Tax=Seohaeicola zhoushanensis TaxID=1569283 RepID=A0A8J3MA51_9RHOB|nr:hypothetical protein [Seohaeicola zhoushanensis]GHF71280.1 hypothetical protein GCM10017056_47750 [Seohaeicola zhoushanensis]
MKALVLSLVLAAGQATAQSNCAARDLVVANLAKKFGERPQVVGLDDRGAIMQVFASPESGTWTVALTWPNGRMCLIASGSALEAAPAAAAIDLNPEP